MSFRQRRDVLHVVNRDRNLQRLDTRLFHRPPCSFHVRLVQCDQIGLYLENLDKKWPIVKQICLLYLMNCPYFIAMLKTQQLTPWANTSPMK